MDKYQNKYRNGTTRAKFWNYGWHAYYFITLCIHKRISWFGNIVQGEMVLSKIGEIAREEWLNTFHMRPDMNLTKGEFVVMPDHFHAIIGIGYNEFNSGRCIAMHCGTTIGPKNKFGPQSKNLPSIVRGFKISVTRSTRLIYPEFKWQPRYHDHIIRDEISFQRISKYIVDNPVAWSKINK